MNTRLLILIAVILFTGSYVRGQEPATSVPVFAYHRFGDDRFPSTNISLKVFENQLKHLQEQNYKVLTLHEAYKMMKSGNLPARAAVLTVDDGYLSFYENALPLLKKYDMPATLFVNTEYVGGGDFMSWQQIQEVQEAGIEIGNHSHAHPHFLNEKDPVATYEQDTEKAQSLFRKHLNISPGAYSYPYGEYNEELTKAVKKAGFYASTAQRSGVMSKEGNLFAIPRFPMGGPFATLEGFKSKLTMLPLKVEVHSPSYTTDKQASVFRFEIRSNITEGTVQCFVDGSKQSLQQNKNQYTVKLPDINSRRTLLTVTAQDMDSGRYRWFSFVVVDTSVEEQ